MRYLIAAAALALAGCGAVAEPVNSAGTIAANAADTIGAPAPATIADKTTLDERGLLAVERSYAAARTAVEAGVDAGVIKSATAARVARADAEAYRWLQVLRRAYATGNATSYADALAQAKAAIAQIFGDA